MKFRPATSMNRPEKERSVWITKPLDRARSQVGLAALPMSIVDGDRVVPPLASGHRRPLHSLDLALEDLNLAPEYQHLSLEPSTITVIGRNHVQQSPKQRIDQRNQHPGAKS